MGERKIYKNINIKKKGINTRKINSPQEKIREIIKYNKKHIHKKK